MATRKPKPLESLPPLPTLPARKVALPDLSKFTETTRRRIYSHVESLRFELPFSMTAISWRLGDELPIDAMERVELTVFAMYGRWWVTWRDPAVDKHLPIEYRFRMLQVKAARTAPAGLVLEEC